jgi:alpha-L-fucosidase 2
MKGWCMGHSTDVWGNARSMGVFPMWAATYLGGQWMAFHILEHYRFNRDPQFLRDHWDILTASTEFCESYLIPGPDGTLMARPASSPENTFFYTDQSGVKQRAALSAGTTVEQFMILQVFKDYIEAAEVLGKMEDPLVKCVQALLPKIYRPKVASDGRLMEWRLPFEEVHRGHRHISHVIGAYPGNVINLDTDPAMRDAVIKSVEGRLAHGGAGTGWSRAWTIGMFARFSDGEKAYENFHAILAKSTLDNLWDWHPPFQIDGNFGATAALAEMLLHSHNGEIKLLPALPPNWKDGSIQGLRARGDYTVDITWAAGELTEAIIRAGDRSPSDIRVVYKNKPQTLKIQAGKSVTLTPKEF